MAYPAYPLELRSAPDGHVYLKMEHGEWAWAGQKVNGAWAKVNGHYELLLARHLRDDGRVQQLRPEPSPDDEWAELVMLDQEGEAERGRITLEEAERRAGRPFIRPLGTT